MSGITALWCRSYQSPACLRLLSSCAKRSRRPEISVGCQIKVVDQYSTANHVRNIRRLPLSSGMDNNWLITSKPRDGAIPGSLGISSFHHGYSDTGINAEASQSTVSNVLSTESSEVGAAGCGGGSWTEILDNASKSTVDATTDAGVATGSAARDVLDNILSGFSLQFSKPFSVSKNIKFIKERRHTYHCLQLIMELIHQNNIFQFSEDSSGDINRRKLHSMNSHPSFSSRSFNNSEIDLFPHFLDSSVLKLLPNHFFNVINNI